MAVKMTAKMAAARLTSQVCAVRSQSVNFSDDIIYYDVMPYAEIYPKHPSQIITTAHGYKPIKPHADRWTGKSAKVMEDRRRKIWEKKTMDNAMTRRELILRQLQNNGAMMLTNCASDPCITALILRYCHRSQAKSGIQIMTPHDLPAEADSPIDHLQAHGDKVHIVRP